jgi:hypothetical protein
MQIYIAIDGQQNGPFSLDEVNAHIRDGGLPTESAMAWFEGCSEWVPLTDVPGVATPASTRSGTAGDSHLVVMERPKWPGSDFLKKATAQPSTRIALVVFVVALAVGLWFGGGPGSEGKWVTFTPPARDFSVTAPKTLTYEASPLKTAVGTLTQHAYSTSLGRNVFLAVQAVDFPRGLFNGVERGKVLDGARDGAVAMSKTILVSESEIVRNKIPGREFLSKSPDEKLFVLTQLFLVGDRMYVLIAVSPKANDPRSRRFIDSFRVN